VIGEGGERVFLDTNIVIYCFDSTDPRKQEIAKTLVTQALSSSMGVVSNQVLQEFCNVASNSRKLSLALDQIMAYVNLVLQPMNQIAIDPQVLQKALSIRSTFQYAFYDSLIIAAALEAKCTTLYSEDMQQGQMVESTRIVNPFLTVLNEGLV
jgi:predicted nucleic acid-binding protein